LPDTGKRLRYVKKQEARSKEARRQRIDPRWVVHGVRLEVGLQPQTPHL